MRKLIVIILALAMTFSLMACAQKQEQQFVEDTQPVTEPPAPVKKQIHILMPAAEEGWECAVQEQAQLAAEKVKTADKYDVITYLCQDSQQQSETLAEIAAMSGGCSDHAVVAMPLAEQMDADFSALLEANVTYALANIIPAGAEAASVANVRYDQRTIGAAVAAWLVEKGLTQEQKVLIIQGLSEEEAQRTEGFQQYLKGKLALNGAVIETPWTTTENIVYSDMQGETAESAQTYFTAYLEESDHAQVKYVAAWNDDYVLGILNALEGETINGENKSVFLNGQPFIAGCGGSQALLDVISGTTQNTAAASLGGLQTVVYTPDILKIALEAMVSHLDGTVVEQDNTLPIVWATSENVNQFKGY